MFGLKRIDAKISLFALLASGLLFAAQAEMPGRPPAAAAAKEEPFGEPPSDWFPPSGCSPDGRRYAMPAKQGRGWVMVVDGERGPVFEKVSTPRFSPDSRHVAYRATRTEDKWFMVIDGKAEPEFKTTGWPSYGDDGKHHAYWAMRGDNRWTYVEDGVDRSDAPSFEEVHLQVLSPDFRHVACWAKSGPSRWTVVVDGKAGPEFAINEFTSAYLDSQGKTHKAVLYPDGAGKFGPIFSPDSQHIAYLVRRDGNQEAVVIDGKVEPDFKSVQLPVFSPDSRHFAYKAMGAEGRWVMVVDGKPGQEFQGLPRQNLKFSTDSQHIAYLVERDDKHKALVIDGREGSEFESVELPTFSADCQRFAYRAKRSEEKWVMVVDGAEQPESQWLGPPLFAPSGHRLAYAARRRSKLMVILEDKEGSEFDALSSNTAYQISHYSPSDDYVVGFSPNGQRLAYLAKRGEKRFIVLDGQEGPGFQLVLGQPVFSPDSQQVAYAAWDQNAIVVVLDGKTVNTFSPLKGSPLYSNDHGPQLVNYNWTADQLGRLGPLAYPAMVGSMVFGNLSASPVNFIQNMSFSPDGSRFAFILGHGGGSFATGDSSRAVYQVVVDGERGQQYKSEGIKGMVFSPDSRHLAYVVANKAGKSMFVNLDGNEGKTYSEIISCLWEYEVSYLRFTSENTLVYLAREGRNIYRVTQHLP